MKRGLSLIILIITIIAMIVLSGTVIVSLQNNNVVNNAKNAVDKTDLATYRQELGVSLMRAFKENPDFKKETFNTSDFDIIKKYIPSMKVVHKGMLEIVKGQLVKVGGVKPNIKPEEKPENKPGDIIVANEANSPKLVAGMTPIKYEDGQWKEVNLKARSNDWYDYENKIWANAKTKDGSMFVWIPRFAYSINEYKTPRSGLEGKQANLIKIEFLKGIEDNNYPKTYTNATIDKPTPMIVHPAFEFEGKPIEGFWIAKYKANKHMIGKPTYEKNEKFYDNVRIGEAFTLANKFADKEHLNADSHLLKNTEWGAVAYLAASKYGIIPQQNLATTENATGVYGMNSNVGEYIAAFMDNSNMNLSMYGNEDKIDKEQIEKEQDQIEEQQEQVEKEQEKLEKEQEKVQKEEEKQNLENEKQKIEAEIKEKEKNEDKYKDEIKELKKKKHELKEKIEELEDDIEDLEEDLKELEEELNKEEKKGKNIKHFSFRSNKVESFYGSELKTGFKKYWDSYEVDKTEKKDDIENLNNKKRKELIDVVYNKLENKKGDALYEVINRYSYWGNINKKYNWLINEDDNIKNKGKAFYNNDDILLGNVKRVFAIRGAGAGDGDNGEGIFSIRFGTGEAEKNVSFRTVLIVK